MGWFRRLAERLTQSDEVRLAEETREWADSIPDTTRINELASRGRARVAGEVERLIVRPAQGLQSLEAVVTDGTGELTAAWMGRSSIPGLVLGTRLVLEGVVGDSRSGRRMVNPSYEFA